MEKYSNDQWIDLKRFESVGAKIGKPYVTISSRKTLTLSAGFLHHAKEQIGKNGFVLLSYSKSKNAVVFEFTSNEKESGALKLTRGANALLGARSFFNYCEIDVEKYKGKYLARVESIPGRDKCWVVYLNEPVNVKG